jgi:hypothetical protein
MRKVGFIIAMLALWTSYGEAQPQIARQPQGATVVSGKPVSFSVEAVGAAPLRYQWSFNGQDLPGATQRVLTRLATPSRAGTYAVRVADTAGQVVSSAARLDVVNRPVFLVQPKNQIVAEHTVAEFRTVLNDSGPYTRMIWHNNNPIEGPHEIPPSTGYITDEPILSMTNPLNDATWNSIYWLAVTNSAVGIVSRKARLTVVGAPVLTVQPQHRDVRPGAIVVFSVRVQPNPGPPETFQWFKDGSPLPGATARTLIRRNVQAADQGNYYCVVSGMGGNTPSWGAFLTVTPAP